MIKSLKKNFVYEIDVKIAFPKWGYQGRTRKPSEVENP